MYSEVKDDLFVKLKDAEFFAATTDLWTSGANHPYLSYTIHFITRDWSLESFCLDTVPLFEDHTGQNIGEAIQDILMNWNLSPDSLVATTTDNGSNFIAGMDLMGWTRLSCFGHNLDLAINQALSVPIIQQAIRRCHALVALFHRSWKKNRDLRQKQSELKLKQHQLLSDVQTRWGSTQDMIARILEQQQVTCAVLAEDCKHWHHMPSVHEFSTLEAVSSVLQPLSTYTDALSGVKNVTVLAILPLLQHILDKLLEVSCDDCPKAKEMKETIAGSL